MSSLNPKRVAVLLIFSVNLLISAALFALPALMPQYGVFNRDASQLIFISASGDEIVKQQVRTGAIIKRIPFKLTAGSSLLAPTPDGFKLLSVHAKGIDVIHNGTGEKDSEPCHTHQDDMIGRISRLNKVRMAVY